MHFDEYEQAVMRTAGPATSEADLLHLCALGLCGESGEFADLIKKHLHHGHDISKSKLLEELGDILWYVARACNALSVPMTSVANGNVRKLWLRYPEGFTSERSINRGTCVEYGQVEDEGHFPGCEEGTR